MNVRNIGCILIALILLSACGGSAAAPTSAPGNASSGGNKIFAITVTGAATITLDPTNAAASLGSDSSSGTTTITFANKNAKQSVSLVFWGIQPANGVYDIHKLFELKDKKGVTGLLVDNSNKSRTFTAGSGQLTLQIQDGKYSGSFNFAATGGEIGGDMTQSATVNGSFSGVQ